MKNLYLCFCIMLSCLLAQETPKYVSILQEWENKDSRESVLQKCLEHHRESPAFIENLIKTLDAPEVRHNRNAVFLFIELANVSEVIQQEIIDLIEHPEDTIKVWAVRILGKMPGSKKLSQKFYRVFQNNKTLRVWIVMAFSEQQTQDEIALDILKQALFDSTTSVNVKAIEALQKLPDKAIVMCGKLLQSQDTFQQKQCCKVLSGIKNKPSELVLAIEKITHSTVPLLRLEAVRALEYHAGTVENRLIELLGDKNLSIQNTAIEKLCNHVTPMLLKALEEGATYQRVNAAITIGQSQAKPGFVEALIKNLRDKKAIIRGASCLAFKKMGQGAALAVPELIKILRSEQDSRVVLLATQALSAIGRPAVVSLANIVKSKKEPKTIRSNACLVLYNIGLAADDAIPFLLESIKEPDSQLKLQIIKTLGKIGRGFHPVVFVFMEQLQDPNPEIRVAVIKFLVTNYRIAPQKIKKAFLESYQKESNVYIKDLLKNLLQKIG